MKVNLSELMILLSIGVLGVGVIVGSVNQGAHPLPTSLIIGSVWMLIGVLMFSRKNE